nr:CAunnamed protein product [Biomphalaria glabrata]
MYGCLLYRVRSEGSSGIKQTRNYVHGTSSYFDNTHVGVSSMMSIHDHSNYHDTLGMGEVIAVLNGVEFRTRHNDYRLVEPDPTNTTFRAVRDILPPPTPPAVLSQPTLDLQIKELRQWFKAFQQQNTTLRDYRPYFVPVLCYLEGFWSLEEAIKEPFASDRHLLLASSWQQLLNQIIYTSYTGNKDLNENMAFLPSAIISIDATGRPLYAQWNYRILCKQPSVDIPLKYFRRVPFDRTRSMLLISESIVCPQQIDLPTLARSGTNANNVNNTRLARFRLTDFDPERQESGLTLLDKLMQEIPGLDNNPSFLNEVAFGQTIYNERYPNNTRLNTGYYHRRFKTGTAGAMGTSTVMRGFHDELLFMAETTQPLVAPVNFTICYSASNCTTRTSRFSYAIPLEVVYMTPLLTWDPYDLPDGSLTGITKGGRNGDTRDPAQAFNGTNPIVYFYKTPVEFYNSTASQKDPADTSGAVGVLDSTGTLRIVYGSGIQIFTENIQGVGSVRLRYPIPPIHGEGSTVWKELSVVKQQLSQLQGSGSVPASNLYQAQLQPTSVGGLHYHEFTLYQQDFDLISNSQIVTVSTSLSNGHSHVLDLALNATSGNVEYLTCNGAPVCPDLHPKVIKFLSSSG